MYMLVPLLRSEEEEVRVKSQRRQLRRTCSVCGSCRPTRRSVLTDLGPTAPPGSVSAVCFGLATATVLLHSGVRVKLQRHQLRRTCSVCGSGRPTRRSVLTDLGPTAPTGSFSVVCFGLATATVLLHRRVSHSLGRLHS